MACRRCGLREESGLYCLPCQREANFSAQPERETFVVRDLIAFACEFPGTEQLVLCTDEAMHRLNDWQPRLNGAPHWHAGGLYVWQQGQSYVRVYGPRALLVSESLEQWPTSLRGRRFDRIVCLSPVRLDAIPDHLYSLLAGSPFGIAVQW